VLVTGGSGFVGSHLVERHLALGDPVTIVDDFSTGSMANIEHLKSRAGFAFHIGTVTDQPLMADLIDSSNMIYHLAAAVGVRLVLDEPIKAMHTNILGTEIVLGLAADKRKRVLVTSTSEVYGKQDRVPFREGDDLVLGATYNSRWSYACSKAIDEFLAIAYWRERNVPTVVARLFNAIGPRQTGRYGMVVPTLVRQALTGEDMTVFGDGSQSRCFTHVSDIVNALISIAADPLANGEIYNVGSSHEITILELAHLIKHLTGSDSRILIIPYQQAYKVGFEDTQRRVPDVTKLTRQIGFQPRYTLEQTLVDVIRDQKSRLR
jgi:UDP-glucose 4-epimerase